MWRVGDECGDECGGERRRMGLLLHDYNGFVMSISFVIIFPLLIYPCLFPIHLISFPFDGA